MSGNLQIYKKEDSFEKKDFEQDFDKLVQEYIIGDNMEFSAKKFFTDNAKNGFLIDYVLDNKLPVDITMYVTVKDVMGKGKNYLTKFSKNTMSKEDTESIFNVVSNVGMTLIDNLIGTKVIRYDVPFKAKYESLIFQYSVNGKPTHSLQKFIEKYSSISSNPQKNQEDEVKNFYKKKTHNLINSLVSKLHKGIDDYL